MAVIYQLVDGPATLFDVGDKRAAARQTSKGIKNTINGLVKTFFDVVKVKDIPGLKCKFSQSQAGFFLFFEISVLHSVAGHVIVLVVFIVHGRDVLVVIEDVTSGESRFVVIVLQLGRDTFVALDGLHQQRNDGGQGGRRVVFQDASQRREDAVSAFTQIRIVLALDQIQRKTQTFLGERTERLFTNRPGNDAQRIYNFFKNKLNAPRKGN